MRPALLTRRPRCSRPPPLRLDRGTSISMRNAASKTGDFVQGWGVPAGAEHDEGVGGVVLGRVGLVTVPQPAPARPKRALQQALH